MSACKKYKTLRLILGDQLNAKHSWFSTKSEHTVYVIAELHQETNYVKHHIQKLCAFFKAMESFATALKKAGHDVLYLTLDDTASYKNFPDLLKTLAKKHHIENIQYQQPDEYRLTKQLEQLNKSTKLDVQVFDSEHFLLQTSEIAKYITPEKHNRMEAFYRKMRKRFNILMDDEKPLGGQWNYDQENRKSFSKKDLENIPKPLVFSEDVSDIISRLDTHKIKYFGKVQNNLIWPTTRQKSLEMLQYFCEVCLPRFGTFQDAMTKNHEHHWSLYHSRLSFSINSKILSPKDVIEKAISVFNASDGAITLAQIEGFVRQILGWREYIRAVYWANMPTYSTTNKLQAKRSMPEYFWTGNTKMACMKTAITQSLDYAYAHHIQRLMITGNFSLLTGLNPSEVDAWYLGIYIDAIEWVEMPNTRGMSLFADGGLIATKPYASSGNYINKMSDYCSGCEYSVKEKETDNACPFNSLYWHFLNTHKKKFENNPRMAMMYKNFEKQDEKVRSAVLTRGQWCIDNLSSL